jgi:hypothetical protein
MTFYEDEYLFGLKKETELKDIIQIYFNTTELRKLSKFHPFDYKTSNCFFEIKTRRTRLNDFPTTLIGYNKFVFAEALQNFENCYFIFQFIDGLYYYKYEKNDINIYEQKHIYRRDRNETTSKYHMLIPNEKLTKIDI